ncbi:uncharacterized protein [Argopecten irradians]|uniref:uncharacterized protein n=1 Tax=Argopecten irradians TaxID=31199 RepID=UPI0037138843
MTEEGFRKTFRSARPEGSETFLQFATRLENYIERWVELSKTTKSYVSLKDLMLRDQFIHGCGQELSLFLKERSPASFEEMAKRGSKRSSQSMGMPVVKGYVGTHCVSVLRDTVCSGVVVRRCLVDKESVTDKVQVCTFADGSKLEAPIAVVEVDSPYFVGTTEAWALETPLYDLIIGNIPGALPPDQSDEKWEKERNIQAVETRAQVKKKGMAYKSLKVPDFITDICSVEELKEEQQKDPTLTKFRKLASEEETYERDDGGSSTIFYQKGVMYRRFQSPKVRNGMTFRQLIVPERYRDMVMRLAHESVMSGHLAAKRTANRVLSEFFWPGVQAEVTRFCRSCDICQRTFPKGRVPTAPLGDMPLIDTPFKRIAVDLIGPLDPATDRGNRFILTVVDYATRYPEAVDLKSIDTERVAEALVDIFSRVGIPSEMLSDQGAQFTSDMMREGKPTFIH